MTWGVAIRHRRCRAQRDQVTGPTARGEGSASDEPPGGSGRSEAEPSPDPQEGSASDEPPGGSGRSEAEPSPDPQEGSASDEPPGGSGRSEAEPSPDPQARRRPKACPKGQNGTIVR